MNINSKTLTRMKQNFEGKVCTIFTKPVCKTFTERVWREHYAVRINEITLDGIWAEHPYAKTQSFFVLDQIVFLQEEVELDPNNPLHAKMIKEYEEQSGEKILSDISPHLAPSIDYGQVNLDEVAEPDVLPVMEKNNEQVEKPVQESVFVDIESLNELAKFTKKQSAINKLDFTTTNSKEKELVQIR